ncbi:MAG: hypothetical protein H0S85_11005 [Desulfovibrionaceae bacterium]|jgi:hypothetical protein|nr:hypothetical protein [Desulfovibrionaceae bacterium]
MNHAADVLLYAEDPGAANFLAPLPAALGRKGIGALLLAEGPAAAWLDAGAADYARPQGPAGAILDALRPGLLLVGTSENKRSLGLELVDAARQRRIPSVGVVDMGMNAAHRFRGASDDPLRHAPDHLAVPDAWTGRAFEALGVPATAITVCGHPHYDVVRAVGERLDRRDPAAARRELFPGAGPEAPVIVFAAELSDGLDPDEFLRSAAYTLQGSGRSDKRTDVVLDEFLLAVRDVSPRPHLVLRLHPKNEPGEFAAVLDGFDQVSRTENAHEIVHAADGVVGMTSMLLLEALILGTPTFSIVPRACETTWLPSIQSGATPVACSREEVAAKLPAFLAAAAGRKSRGTAHGLLFGALERLTAHIGTWLRDPRALLGGGGAARA